MKSCNIKEWDMFKSGRGDKSITKFAQSTIFQYEGNEIQIIDVPGLFDGYINIDDWQKNLYNKIK